MYFKQLYSIVVGGVVGVMADDGVDDGDDGVV